MQKQGKQRQFVLLRPRLQSRKNQRGTLLLKLDATITVLWETFYASPAKNANYADGGELVQTQDGGYAVVSNGALVSGNDSNYLLTKLNSLSGISWQKEFGGSNYDISTSVKQTTDGDYIMSGYTNSHD
jgi:hypothetical protein